MYIYGSLDNTVSGEDGETTFGDILVTPNNTFQTEDFDIVDKIHSIRNKSVRNLLIVCGYLLAKIDSLEKDYYELLHTCTPEVLKNLGVLQEKIFNEEEIKNLKGSGVKVKTDRRRNKKVTFKDIIGAFGSNYFGLDGNDLLNNVEDELKTYIDYTMFDGLSV